MEFIAISVGHTGTILNKSQQTVEEALASTRPTTLSTRHVRGASDLDSSPNARAHDLTIFKAFMMALIELVQSRLARIITHRQRLAHACTCEVSPTRTISEAAPTHYHDTHLQGASLLTHFMHKSYMPECAVII